MADHPTRSPEVETVQHEKQKLMLCLRHALNNALQGAVKKFHKSELDGICVTLANGKSFFNPHRSIFGLGNYDVNVLSAAVQSRGFEVSWHDARKDVKQVDLDQHFAIIANQRTAAKWYFFGRRGYHWLAIRRFGAHYLNLDSMLAAPKPFATIGELREFLAAIIKDEGHVLFLNKTSSGAGEAPLAVVGAADTSAISAADDVAQSTSTET